MPDWKKMLDGIAAGRFTPPPHAQLYRIPTIDGWEPGRVWCDWIVDKALIQPQGRLFGGALAAIADEFLGVATLTVLEENELTTTADLSVNFLGAIRAGEKLRIEGRVVSRGRSSVYVEVTFTDEAGNLRAKARATQVAVRPKS